LTRGVRVTATPCRVMPVAGMLCGMTRLIPLPPKEREFNQRFAEVSQLAVA